MPRLKIYNGTSWVYADSAGLEAVVYNRMVGIGYVGGTLTVANDVGANLIVDAALTIQAVRLYVKTAPTGSAITVDIQRSTDDGATWASIFTVLPTIAATAKVGGTAATLAITSLAAGTVLRLDVTGVGSTVAGADLTAQLNCVAA